MKSKVIYVKGNRLGMQYAVNGLMEYASKWKIYNTREYSGKTPSPKLIDFNISITEKLQARIEADKWYLQNW